MEIAEGSPVIRGVRGYRCYDASTLCHGNGLHGESIHDVIRCEGRLEREADKFLALDIMKTGVLAKFLSHLLECEIASGSVRADEVLVILHLKDAILTFREHIAVGLAIHGLWSEGSSHEVDFLTSELLLHGLRNLEALDLDSSVFLWAHTFSLRSIMIGARLTIDLGVDSVALAKLDLVSSLKGVELPSDERIIEGIDLGSDEGTAPVSEQSERL